MKRTLVVLIAVLALAFATPVMANQQNANDNFMSPTQQQTANGNGVNIGGDYNGGGNVEGGVNAYGGNSVNTIGNATSLFGDANSGQIMNNNQNVGDIDNSNKQTMIGGGNATTMFGDANTGNIIEEGAVQVDSHDKTYNTNMNTNLNSQETEQKQGQVQGQGQQQKQANKQITVIEDAENKRNLPGSHGSAYNAKGPDYREKAKDTANVAPIEELLEIRDTWTLRELLVLAGSPRLDFELRVLAYRSHRVRLEHPKTGTKGMNLDTAIKLIVDKPSGKDLAMVRVVAQERDVDSVNVVALAAIEAIRHGASQLYITKADFERLMTADAWGIMFGGSGSIIKDSGMTGTGAVIAPGIGYGESESGYNGLPYVRAYAFE